LLRLPSPWQSSSFLVVEELIKKYHSYGILTSTK